MSPSLAREDNDNISAISHSSRISYEVDPFLIIEEISKQAYNDSDEDESDDEEEPLPHYLGDNLIDKEINTGSLTSLVGSKGCIQRVASDLSLCSTLSEKEGKVKPTSTTLKRSKLVLAMFEKRIIDKEVKAGKIDRACSMNGLGSRRNSLNRTGSSYSFRRRPSSCKVISEDTEANCNQNATFDFETRKNISKSGETSVPVSQTSNSGLETPLSHSASGQRTAAASSSGHAMLGASLSGSVSRQSSASKMGHAMLGASLSKGASRRSSAPPQMIDVPNKEVPTFTSLINELKNFWLGLDNELANSDDTLDTAALTDLDAP